MKLEQFQIDALNGLRTQLSNLRKMKQSECARLVERKLARVKKNMKKNGFEV